MLTLATLFTVVGLLTIMRMGRGDDGRLLPLSTTQGKIVRVITGVLLALLVVLMINLADKEGGHSTAFWMRALVIGAAIIFIKFLRDKDV